MCSKCGARLDQVEAICMIEDCFQCDGCCTCDPPLWKRLQDQYPPEDRPTNRGTLVGP